MTEPKSATDPQTSRAGPLGVGQRISYGAGDLGFVLLWQGAALFLLYFYTDILHLSPWTAGAIYLAGMVWDAVSDPLIAIWAERRVNRTGRYGPMIVWSAVPIGLSYILMFSIPTHAGLVIAVWALASHLVFRTAFTYAAMPYSALPARMTRDSDERTSLSALRVVFAAIAGLAVAVATPLLVQAAAESGESAGYRFAAIATGASAAAVLLLSSAGLRESPAGAVAMPASNYLGDLGDLWSGMWRNAPPAASARTDAPGDSQLRPVHPEHALLPQPRPRAAGSDPASPRQSCDRDDLHGSLVDDAGGPHL